MRSLYLFGLALLHLIALSDATLIVFGEVTCSTISIKVNATASQFENLPQDLQVVVDNEVRVAPFPPFTDASIPDHGTEMEMQATVAFDSPFMFSDGFYNMTVNLITSETTNYTVATYPVPNAYFSGCSSTDSTTATPTSVNINSYYSAIGVPTHGISTDPQNSEDADDAGLTSGEKIGITVGVLAVALLAVLGAMALLFRRSKRNQQLSTGGKATRYVDGKWINEDRNSAELKEIHQAQV